MKRQARDFIPHLERYIFAMPHVQGLDVMDAASKDGYGSSLLAQVANKVTLVDNSAFWLGKAESNYTYQGKANFIVDDFNKGFPEGEWDAVVAFEIIEHVEDPDFFISNITSHLKKGGELVFSVPHMKEEECHLTLFDEDKIRGLISKYLTITEFYVQKGYGISNIPFSRYPVTYVGIAVKS